VTQDPVLGYAYVSRAAAQGLAPAKDTLAQLDKLLSVEDRKKGVALAMAKAKAAPAPSSKKVQAAAVKKTPVIAKAKPPKPEAIASASEAAPASGAWRIQLGAFSQRGSAEALFKKLSANGAIAGQSAVYVPVGAITRLQVGPFASRAAAQAACNSLKGQPCFPVAAK
jgi:cell division septation protein DedD